MSERIHDVMVIGLGGMGSAAAYHLARRGQRVLGLDAHPRGHALGSSHGRSRIIREAYYEAPEYVPLVQRAYALWRELERTAGCRLLTITGGITIGEPSGEMVTGAVASAEQHGLPYERLSADEVNARFPGFRLPDALVGVVEPNAGILDPEACVAAHLDLAAAHGATLRYDEPVRCWAADGNGVRVETDGEWYRADRLVIAAGPWASEMLAGLTLPLRVRRVVNVHFAPDEPARFAPAHCPVYLWDVPEGQYYGFPHLPGQGVKFGRHDVEDPCTPRTIRRTVDAAEIDALRTALNRYLPGAASAVLWTLTCMYTLTPDLHFVLDQHPAYPQVVYGAGFSGHGLKFASAIGEVLADLAMTGTTGHTIDFLAASRFSPA